MLDRRRWRTRAELEYAIVYWIEHTYNRRRRQRALGKLTPVEFELAFTNTAQAVTRSPNSGPPVVGVPSSGMLDSWTHHDDETSTHARADCPQVS